MDKIGQFFSELFNNLFSFLMTPYGIITILVIVLFVFIFVFSRNYSLNTIKSERVGDGQHGDAKWLEEKDLEKYYRKIELPPTLVDMSKEWKIGRLVHLSHETKDNKTKTFAYIDESSSHAAIEAPTNVGKTTQYVVPNIQYNAMCGASMIIPDIKGELRRILQGDLEKKLNYRVQTISFFDVQESIGIDYLAQLNAYIEKSKTAKNTQEKEYYQAKAETEAKIIATAITSTRERTQSENGFFLSASNGLISTALYLVSLFGKEGEKHFSSVRNIIQSMGTGTSQRSALADLLGQHDPSFPPRKLSGAGYSASKETESNIYASALGDLEVYTNALAEQVVSTEKEKFDWKSLIDEKTIVFIELPETRKDMFAFFTLFFTQVYERLTEYAQGLENNTLPRIIKIIWDEFGISPQVKDLQQMLNVSRGRGILLDLIYQSQDQIEENYGKLAKDIIRKACSTNIYLGLSTVDIETAEVLSKILGKYTIKSGSVSKSKDHNDWIFNKYSESITEQMMERALMNPDELLRLRGNKILLKQNVDPFKPTLLGYYEESYPTKLIYKKKTDILKDEYKNWLSVKYLDFERMRVQLQEYDSTNDEEKKEVEEPPVLDINDVVVKEYFKEAYNKMTKVKVVPIDSNINILIKRFAKEDETISKIASQKLITVADCIAALALIQSIIERKRMSKETLPKASISIIKQIGDYMNILERMGAAV